MSRTLVRWVMKATIRIAAPRAQRTGNTSWRASSSTELIRSLRVVETNPTSAHGEIEPVCRRTANGRFQSIEVKDALRLSITSRAGHYNSTNRLRLLWRPACVSWCLGAGVHRPAPRIPQQYCSNLLSVPLVGPQRPRAQRERFTDSLSVCSERGSRGSAAVTNGERRRPTRGQDAARRLRRGARGSSCGPACVPRASPERGERPAGQSIHPPPILGEIRAALSKAHTALRIGSHGDRGLAPQAARRGRVDCG